MSEPRSLPQPFRVLAIESSCDETGAAIVEDGRVIRANVLASSASIHARYGGVVPEIASRHQMQSLIPVLEETLSISGLGWDDLDLVAATYGPGLAGSLLVGLTAGKALALSRGLPFLGVNHLEAHIYASWLHTGPEGHTPADPKLPLLALVVSGAHTELVWIPRHGRYELLGQTRDDAAGEAFDKVARMLDLGYPGGPAIERAAQGADPAGIALPRAWIPGTHDFSFSGLKTHVSNLLRKLEEEGHEIPTRALAAAFQDAVVDVLARKTLAAARERGAREVLLAGGVAANLALRARLSELLAPEGIMLRFPPVALCTDNAAMIASAAYFHARAGERDTLDLDVRPDLTLPFAEGHA
ncbi:MAG TPA: tRNA (adenosine(37)-N6)-threonylcarbamoyltransferase complex transferase subunit TsaD [Ktedonobacterales bacterium]